MFKKWLLLLPSMLFLTLLMRQTPIVSANASVQPYFVYVKNDSPTTNIYIEYRSAGTVPNLNDGLFDQLIVANASSCPSTPATQPGLLPLPDGDFLVIWSSDGCFSRFSADSTGTFIEQDLGVWDNYGRKRGVADLNGDGNDDLLLTSQDVQSSGHYDLYYQVALGDNSGNFDFTTPQVLLASNIWMDSVSLADITGDSILDLQYMVNSHGGTFTTKIHILEGIDDGNFDTIPQLIATAPTNVSSHGQSAADFNEDGLIDIFLSVDDDNPDNGQTSIFFNNGDETFTLQESFDFLPADESESPDQGYGSGSVCDINLDGHVDIMGLQSYSNYSITAYLGDGSGSLTKDAVMYANSSRGIAVACSLHLADEFEGELWIEPTPASVVIDETVDVELMFDAGTTDVYGMDIILTYDPTIVSVLDIAAGSCLDNPFLEEINDGIIHVAAAAAETDACTTGSAAVITFQGDVGGISPVEFDTWEISDGMGQPITLDATDGSIEVLTNGDVTGQVDLQGRADDESGAIVTLLDGSTVIATTTTDAAGNYAFDVLAGTYDITVEHPSYLDAEKSDIVVLAGSATTLNPVTLLAGDVNDSGCVDIFDVASIAAQFESTSPSPTHLDVNGDGVISITDISLAAYDNYQTCELIPWP